MSQLTEQNLSADDIAVLEVLRSRMMPLRYNIDSLHMRVVNAKPNTLPSW